MPRRPDLARRAELANAAFEVLRTRGVGTSMSELADALGVKRPTLYFYFPDIGAVFESVLDQTYAAHAEVLIAKLRTLDHPLDRLKALLEVTFAFHRERPHLIGGLFQLWAVGGRDLTSVLEKGRKMVTASRDALVMDLRGGITRKEVLPCEPEKIVDMVLAVLDGVLVHHVLGIARPEGVMDELIDRVIEPLRPSGKKQPQQKKRRRS
ncbi:MAG TPA: TetR/AcrR family transcriptional regulator [Kofleriaceae bacterium]|nr:TetR/AcrR family transcriptional regulator [Kofleriaceae bacterium]